MKKLKNKDIAHILGISPSTVSLALSNKPGVSEMTRRKIFSLLNSENTTFHASSLSDSSSLLLVIHKKHGEIIIDKPFFSDLIESVQLEALSKNYSLSIVYYTDNIDLNSFIQQLQSTPADGLILLATEMLSEDFQYYKKLDIPKILLDNTFEFEQVDSVTLDNTAATLKAFKYAYDMGHRNIGYLKSSVFIHNFGYRFQGYLQALSLFGLEGSNHPVYSLHCSIEQAYLKMSDILRHLPSGTKMPTCFLADIDYIALGAMRAFQECGYQVPEDISIIGFDDNTACEVCSPQLTTIRVNRTDIGRIAADNLITRIRYPHSYNTHVEVSSELIVRQSVKNISGLK